MSDVIEVKLKQAAIELADAQDYGQAATRVGITISDLKHLVDELERKLCLHVFTLGSQPPV